MLLSLANPQLSLLSDTPRAATVMAMEDAVVWFMDRNTFRYTLAQNTSKSSAECRTAVAKVTLLNGLDDAQLMRVSKRSHSRGYPLSSTHGAYNLRK